MSDSIWPAIHAERDALAHDLDGLSVEQWARPSLCSEWTIHDVLAHQLSGAKMTTPKFFRHFAASRFQFNQFVGKQVRLEGAGGPVATLAAFRSAAYRTSAPPGPKATWLGEAFVHGEDIRRPLGITRHYPLSVVTRAIAFYAGSNTIIGGKNRVAGLTLNATDVDFSIGSGPVVAGPAISLLLAASGRIASCPELTGPGVAVLRERS
jgi:uncharacterized protein (TIGR03083 family)